MAKINLTAWIKENPNGTFEDWKEAIKKVGQELSPFDEKAFSSRENYKKNADSGTSNELGKKSMKDNESVLEIDSKLDKMKKEPKTAESTFKIPAFEYAAQEALKNMAGKKAEEQKKIAEELVLGKKESSGTKNIEPPKKEEVSFSEIVKEIEQGRDGDGNDENSSSFLKAFAKVYPTWGKILRSKDLSWGQKVSLVGSALANVGSNVVLGAKSGFEHGSFSGVPWDFKQAWGKYLENELDTVAKADQSARAKEATAAFWKKYQQVHGKEAADELIALFDLYGDNPDLLSSRLRAMGNNMNANEIKTLYANLEKTNLSESAKQKILETKAKIYENMILKLSADEKLKTNDKVIAAKNALNDLQTTSATFDEKTYKLRKVGGMVRDILETVEGAASTVGGVLTGGVVGKVKDGIIRGSGIPQKVVRADGSEIQLDPNDNIYATKNEITTDKDDGSDIVHMTQDDEVMTIYKKLDYHGGQICKDFDYYLTKLRG